MTEIKVAAFLVACLASFLYLREKDAGCSTWLACWRALAGALAVLFGSFGYLAYVYFRGLLTSELWDDGAEFGAYLFAYGVALLSFVWLRK